MGPEDGWDERVAELLDLEAAGLLSEDEAAELDRLIDGPPPSVREIELVDLADVREWSEDERFEWEMLVALRLWAGDEERGKAVGSGEDLSEHMRLLFEEMDEKLAETEAFGAHRDGHCIVCGTAVPDRHGAGVVSWPNGPDGGVDVVCGPCAERRGPMPVGMLAHTDQMMAEQAEHRSMVEGLVDDLRRAGVRVDEGRRPR